MKLVIALALLAIFAVAIASRYNILLICDRKEVVVEEDMEELDL